MSRSSRSAVRQYWNTRIHDLEITTHPAGSPGFFADLDAYHFEKLHHLLRLVDFSAWRGRDVLDVGCGAGVEVVRFARGGARVVGIDLAESAAALTRENVRQQGVSAAVAVADGEALPFRDASMDFVYAHGVMQYTGDDRRLVRECQRVLRSGGLAMFQVYHRRSWLHVLSKVMKVPLEHEDAPVLKRYTIAEFREMLAGFSCVQVVTEGFPVESTRPRADELTMYNTFFVGTFNALPRTLTRRLGWHLLAFCRK